MRTVPLLVLLLASAVLVRSEQQSSPPTFRSRATVVNLDVSVKKGNRPVIGLGASDFVVLDNQVAQKVDRVTYDQVPIDVTLVLDVSYSVIGTIERIRRNASSILELLRPNDRIRVLAFYGYVHELVPLQRAVEALPPLTPGGSTRLRDVLNAALLMPADPDRRRVVVAVTDGEDTYSIASPASLVEVARRTDGTLYVIEVPTKLPSPSDGFSGGVSPTILSGQRGFWPGTARHGVEEATMVTGGRYFGTDFNVVGRVRGILEEFRQSYVITYTLEGVADAGWHELQVQVKGIDAKNIRARRGYFAGTKP